MDMKIKTSLLVYRKQLLGEIDTDFLLQKSRKRKVVHPLNSTADSIDHFEVAVQVPLTFSKANSYWLLKLSL
jgi:hypothetical protein